MKGFTYAVVRATASSNLSSENVTCDIICSKTVRFISVEFSPIRPTHNLSNTLKKLIEELKKLIDSQHSDVASGNFHQSHVCWASSQNPRTAKSILKRYIIWIQCTRPCTIHKRTNLWWAMSCFHTGCCIAWRWLSLESKVSTRSPKIRPVDGSISPKLEITRKWN